MKSLLRLTVATALAAAALVSPPAMPTAMAEPAGPVNPTRPRPPAKPVKPATGWGVNGNGWMVAVQNNTSQDLYYVPWGDDQNVQDYDSPILAGQYGNPGEYGWVQGLPYPQGSPDQGPMPVTFSYMSADH